MLKTVITTNTHGEFLVQRESDRGVLFASDIYLLQSDAEKKAHQYLPNLLPCTGLLKFGQENDAIAEFYKNQAAEIVAKIEQDHQLPINIDNEENTDWLQKLREEQPAHTCVDQPNLPCPACSRVEQMT